MDVLVPGTASSVAVSGVTLDARLVEPGDLFVGLPGRHHHGATFSDAAARAGAVALLTDPAGAALAGQTLPLAVLADPRHAMAGAAATVYGEPARALTTYGITGTQGKTTTAYLLDAALRAGRTSTGLIGTVGFALDGQDLGGSRTTVTTPESPELQGLLGYLLEHGAQALVMEVSSHALALGRVDAIVFDVAAFTGFGTDHLDFHGDVESYFEAKASLFTPERTRHAVLNVDDARGEVLVGRARAAGLGVTTIGAGPYADVHPVRTELAEHGRTRLVARVHGEQVELTLPLPGEYNLRNALTALAMVAATGGDVAVAAQGVERASVPGRMQRVDLGEGSPAVFVDFAHTPEAVTAAIGAVAGSARVLAVLGAGGDRDPGKREPMGAAAAAAADVVVVTDDNPRTEDPAAIRARVLAGARGLDRAGVQVVDGGDRRSAITTALGLAGPDDAVVVLGKGHETGQEIAGVVTPFADAEVVREAWSRLRTDGAAS
uniref:UDP-N-acetylmuramoyl-L-alanyl-D-glutamate--2, 6-diaminopimelate ligase n=1 Tax=Microlunatus antarcticus TaxID=53388 RepID=UPI0016171900|nr:UDP-N-acetylmuramoyl-L-alanyl-D-glutamate--2,6-diaminopimelate ligase [Microlunatus antarcticus]